MKTADLLGLAGAAALLFDVAAAQHSDLDQNGDGDVDGMGPSAFMWPPDRVWFDFADNTGPCGSPDGPNNRTEFPLDRGAISLVHQDNSYDVQVAISYSDNPKTNEDFNVLIPSEHIDQHTPGHYCLNITNPPSNVQAGSNATIQLRYVSDGEKNMNETYYACADIKYVAASTFNYALTRCFNASVPAAPKPSGTAGSGASGTGAPSQGQGGSGSGGGNGLSTGAIAGIVVGVVVGVAALGILLFFLYRRDQRQKRVVDHVTSTRNNVKWDADNRSGVESANDVPLENIPK
ncbi:hypothetical protein Micbo1qcDRAFT_161726 [Microdochium bolleyi]|uniref:Copper acquisition factor BIM1-like domain-containing protein n=1 Tax=Microdochium bolleyi TaxID=196109 RepID=A0A136J3H3_9PEZI|nr:hypothetical protein Micbo1qcDRAFT_161726 [Microdochium bolleyi]